jgi:hypothetical protein
MVVRKVPELIEGGAGENYIELEYLFIQKWACLIITELYWLNEPIDFIGE